MSRVAALPSAIRLVKPYLGCQRRTVVDVCAPALRQGVSVTEVAVCEHDLVLRCL
jgi:hypothetical protein